MSVDTEKNQSSDWHPSWQLKCIFAVVGLLKFMAALDATSISVSLPTISDDLDGTAIEAFWAGTSFLVTSCVFQPVFFLAPDIFGRKFILILTVLFLTFGSILAGAAAGLPKVDYIGSFLFVASLTSFLIPITWGGAMDVWTHGIPLYLSFWEPRASLVSLHERFVATQPLNPLVIFNNIAKSVSYAGCFLHGVILWAIVYYLPLYYEGFLGYSPVVSGVAMFPEYFTVAPISVMTGFIVAKTDRYRWALWFGWPISILCVLDNESSIPKWLYINLVAGIGLGTLYPAVVLAVQAAANPNYPHISVTMTPFFWVFGQAVGVSIGGVVLQNCFKHEFGNHPELGRSASALAQDASSLVKYIETLQENSGQPTSSKAYMPNLW
ncbi:hypothetical protein N7532_008089 [Penicillium argentinense]|uniref:Uncharacterized protein n=1 Tax=Penicillium argentinense TaxID=1131581 RepID=A0A9W9EWZ8_9EURO|nr:uncharacterized protein N7532_008089 [Penicillium argentinense]KAJ5089405.1 hypothetical protein N7532_008089 [Penicillium argentinense]